MRRKKRKPTRNRHLGCAAVCYRRDAIFAVPPCKKRIATARRQSRVQKTPILTLPDAKAVTTALNWQLQII